MGNKKRTLLGAEYEVQDGDRASLLAQGVRNINANRQHLQSKLVEKGKKLLHGVGDFLKKTQETGRTGPKFTNLGRPPGDWMIPPKTQKMENIGIPENRKSPMNHCASDMMHSGGWQEMRKHNSPGTIGNKAGIKHNEKMRQDIGTFKMPHSPLNNNDSIAKAWKDFKAGYMNRKEHMGKPITAEQNLAEYNREKGEFYYDRNKKKLRLIPTDDGEQKIMKGIDKDQLAPDRKSSMSPLNKEGKKDACYHKVKSRVKVWPSAYASGQLVQCRKAGAANWGEKSKKK